MSFLRAPRTMEAVEINRQSRILSGIHYASMHAGREPDGMNRP